MGSESARKQKADMETEIKALEIATASQKLAHQATVTQNAAAADKVARMTAEMAMQHKKTRTIGS